MSQKRTRAPIKNEADNGESNRRGTLAMARTSDINSATAQFFINLRDNDFLDHGTRDFGYAVFGEVSDGMDVVDAIAAVPTGNRGGHQDVPVEAVEIIEGTIDERWPVNTRGNVGEVFPEVVLPLSWSLLGGAAERGWRQAFERMGLVADGGPGAEHGVTETMRYALADEDALDAGGQRIPDQLQQALLTRLGKRALQLRVHVEVVLDGAFRAAGDEYQFPRPGRHRLFGFGQGVHVAHRGVRNPEERLQHAVPREDRRQVQPAPRRALVVGQRGLRHLMPVVDLRGLLGVTASGLVVVADHVAQHLEAPRQPRPAIDLVSGARGAAALDPLHQLEEGLLERTAAAVGHQRGELPLGEPRDLDRIELVSALKTRE